MSNIDISGIIDHVDIWKIDENGNAYKTVVHNFKKWEHTINEKDQITIVLKNGTIREPRWIIEQNINGCRRFLKRFEINGLKAEYKCFGKLIDYGDSPLYGCPPIKFVVEKPIQCVLDKYKITEDIYYEIANELKEKLSFNWACAQCE